MFDEEAYDFVDLFDKEEWEACVKMGAFIPSDGSGYWGTATHFSHDYNSFRPAPEGATHVHWFNK